MPFNGLQISQEQMVFDVQLICFLLNYDEGFFFEYLKWTLCINGDPSRNKVHKRNAWS